MISDMTIELRNLSYKECEELAESFGQPKFRGRQLFEWVHKGKTDLREMTNLPGAFLKKLDESGAVIDPLKLLVHQRSALDGTQKFLWELEDGNAIESVLMEYKYGASVCISSQAGCRMGCSFCASGINGLIRGLSRGEMLSQVMDVSRVSGRPISHIVVMGTGEPFDNYDELAGFIRLVNEKRGMDIGMRNITVSTCGLVPGIKRFSEDFPQVNLAVSLHAPNDRLRADLMPVDRKYSLDILMPACREYTENTGRRITFEYSLIKGVNDTDDAISELASLVKGMLCHVNLIPLNTVSETGMGSSGRERAKEIMNYLEKKGIPATVRRQLGSDIDGACGQLRLKAGKTMR